MSLTDTKARVLGHANDIKRRLLLERNSVMPMFFFINRGQETKKFVSIKELTSGWMIRYNEFRAQMVCEAADVDGDLQNVIALSSFAAYGFPYQIPDGPLMGTDVLDVYGFSPESDRRDVVPPTGSNSLYKVYLVREPRERFILP